jgi:hypothetical protein
MSKSPFDVDHNFLGIFRVLLEVVSQEVCWVRIWRAVMETTVPEVGTLVQRLLQEAGLVFTFELRKRWRKG